MNNKRNLLIGVAAVSAAACFFLFCPLGADVLVWVKGIFSDLCSGCQPE